MPENLVITVPQSPLATAQQIASDGVASVSSAGKSVSHLPIESLIALDKYQKETAIAADPVAAMRDIKIYPGDVRY